MALKKIAKILLLCVFFIQGCGKSGEDYFKSGIEHYNNQRFNESIKLFKKSLKLEPEHIKARFYLGMAYKRLGQVKSAIDEIKYAAEITPNDFYIFYNLADCYRLTEDYNQGVEFARKSLSIKPNFMESHLLLSINLYLSGQIDPARKELEFIVKVTEPDKSDLYRDALYHLGVLYRITKDYDLSIKTFEQLAEITPNDAQIYYEKGITYLAMNDMDNVANQITKLKNLDSPLEHMLRDKLK
ncbi:tetratricopeptide repeat protein [bacterium]|nr:tetratricopeptide repeat protein [bacterium]MCP5462485.1 tetratricopeptide repeat protein [bacterium]